MTMQVWLEPKEQEILIWAIQSAVSDLGEELLIRRTKNSEKTSRKGKPC